MIDDETLIVPGKRPTFNVQPWTSTLTCRFLTGVIGNEPACSLRGVAGIVICEPAKIRQAVIS
jgi:hypothetical protein